MNPSGERLPRRRDEARALFRRAILDAAEVVFAEQGFHRARIQDIADRARLAVGTVYNHFDQKEDLLAALLEERAEEILGQLLPRPDDPAGFRKRLEARVARMLAYVDRHRDFFLIANEHGLFAGTAAPGAPAVPRPLRQVEKFRALFRALVDEGIASGDLAPLEGDTLSRFLGGTMRALVLSSLDDGGVDTRAHAAMTVDLFLHGAARRRPKRSR